MTGRVVDDDGAPLRNVAVSIHRVQVHPPTTAVPRPTGPSVAYNARTRSSDQGLFTFENAPDGMLQVCVQVADPLYPDPCYWDRRSNLVAVAPGQSVNLPRVEARKGQRITVSVLDPSSLLPGRDWTRTRAMLDEEVQVSLRTPVLGFLPLPAISIPGGRKFEVVVPVGVPIPLQIKAGGLSLEDPVTGKRTPQYSQTVKAAPTSLRLLTVLTVPLKDASAR